MLPFCRHAQSHPSTTRAHHAWGVHVCLGLQQRLDHSQVPVPARDAVQRSVAILQATQSHTRHDKARRFWRSGRPWPPAAPRPQPSDQNPRCCGSCAARCSHSARTLSHTLSTTRHVVLGVHVCLRLQQRLDLTRGFDQRGVVVNLHANCGIHNSAGEQTTASHLDIAFVHSLWQEVAHQLHLHQPALLRMP